MSDKIRQRMRESMFVEQYNETQGHERNITSKWSIMNIR